jgi:hypothetical protein
VRPAADADFDRFRAGERAHGPTIGAEEDGLR